LNRAIPAQSTVIEHGVCRARRSNIPRQTAYFDVDASMSTTNSRTEFEKLFLPHLDAAYNLARLLTGTGMMQRILFRNST
jgi:hypothetical protein